jgi:hypothetical protein
MYGPKILDFNLLGPFSLGATAESWAQDGCRRDSRQLSWLSGNCGSHSAMTGADNHKRM